LRHIILAGKGNDVLTIDHQQWEAATWKKGRMLAEPTWGIAVPSCRIHGHRPPFGSLILFFFRQRTTRSDSVLHCSQSSMRGAAIWHLWQPHHVMACFWKIMQSICPMRSMQLHDDGLYTAVLMKVFAYLFALRLQAQGAFSTLTMTESMRTLRREEAVRACLATHFPAPFSIG
jgi:hypothetical protein